jgi:hypothetical protein
MMRVFAPIVQKGVGSIMNAIAAAKARLNVNLSERAREEVNGLSDDTGRSITDLVRIGLSLVKVVFEESRQGNKLIVTTADGKPLKELVIPGL